MCRPIVDQHSLGTGSQGPWNPCRWLAHGAGNHVQVLLRTAPTFPNTLNPNPKP